jgi:hypothetical protein
VVARRFGEAFPGVDIVGPLMPTVQIMMRNDGRVTNEELLRHASRLGRVHVSTARVAPRPGPTGLAAPARRRYGDW